MQNIRNFCIIAHIDHGKSTLADRFLDITGTVEKRKMKDQLLDTMELERERGITIKLQPVRMHYKYNGMDYILNLIDTPGHVDFSYEVSRSLAAVEGAILLVDAVKGIQAQTLANLNMALEQGLAIIPVINKIDLPNARVSEVEKEIMSLLSISSDDIYKVSAKTGNGVKEVLDAVVNEIPAPGYGAGEGFRALIFDSQFDTYKGVIAYVRVFEGRLKAGDKITLAASLGAAEAIEVGYFVPELFKSDTIGAGDIGYIATGLKDIEMVRVGDTILVGDFEPLSGYKEPVPVVFASFYPSRNAGYKASKKDDGDNYDELKDALLKLKLTDASLSYQYESSPGLGRGFRLGFLGMLHIEIISERLRREFGLELVISAPSVEYHVKTKKGEEISIKSASSLPDPSLIEHIEEPFIDLEILSPIQYHGSIMKLMSTTRGEYESSDYLSKEVMVLKYCVPLADILTDFYDNLKSATSGYASMSYRPAGYRAGDLVRLDILVAGELVEPFSKIVPRARAQYEGRKMVEKLKATMPRQLFAVSLQAAVGGKIVAREDLSALRKDVTGYLYGGDVTRKKKLLEKQKKGKARLKKAGKVNIPQEVFLEMLKR